jgi:sulfatase maturation enzyme AslB (radical SAM superfamily)
MSMSREIALIVKVTNACNMACRYCFIEPSVFHKTMVNETARYVVRVFLDSDWFDSVHFVWHGGEPLLRGRRFFEEKDYYCAGYKLYFEHVLRRIHTNLRRASGRL